MIVRPHCQTPVHVGDDLCVLTPPSLPLQQTYRDECPMSSKDKMVIFSNFELIEGVNLALMTELLVSGESLFTIVR